MAQMQHIDISRKKAGGREGELSLKKKTWGGGGRRLYWGGTRDLETGPVLPLKVEEKSCLVRKRSQRKDGKSSLCGVGT